MNVRCLFICACIVTTCMPAHAVIGSGGTNGRCIEELCGGTNFNYEDIDVTMSCATKSSACYGGGSLDTGSSYRLYSCDTCSGNATRVAKSYTFAGNGACSGVVATYYTCECASCTNCTSDTSWSAAGTGYQKKVSRSCNCGTCSESTSYQCAAGYYGSSTNGTSGCTACGNGATSAAGTTSQSGCYIPSGSAFSDSTGSGSYTGDCYY